ncbi:MAG: hypothetical protein KDD67_18350 [Ignavibacteriae bacterium]|nr:hypothetical protein [Ignavibacteriota bacterium]MCB9214523.1 hypothetical protein [Ignavibacteria bacterium]
MKHSKFFALFLTTLSLFALPDGMAHAQSNVGREFYLAFPANWEFPAGEKYIRLYIASEVETRVDIYALGQFRRSVKTKPNDIVTSDLSNLEGQIFVRDDKTPVPDDQIYRNQAVRVVAEDPIILYAMNRTSYTSDGLLALPLNALGKEYVVPSATSVGGATQNLPSQYMITAPYDNTTVTITNPMNTPNHREGETFTITLNQGDVFSAMSVGNGGDLTGAHIVASRPIAVTAGHHCTYIPDFQYPACDHLTEMLTPVTSWGRVYNALPLANRTKGDTYRILAGEPDADILINGVKVATLSRVGGPQGVGWIEYREDARRPLTFSSNKLIQVVQYSNGQQYDNASGSDPFYTILTPVEQYQSNLFFSTLGIDFPQNFFAVVGDSLGIATAEIAKAGTSDWKKLLALSATVSYTFPTSPTETQYAGLVFSSIGTFQVRSEGKLGGIMYAGNSFDSYGFPIALLVENRAIVDTVPPAVEWDIECGNFITATVRDMPDDPAPRSNLSTIWLDYSASSNYRLLVDPFIPNESRTATFRLEAINPREDGRAVVQIRDWSGNVVFDTIDYDSPDLAIASQDFGMVPLNEQRDSLVIVENRGSQPVRLTRFSLLSGSSGFKVGQITGTIVVQPSGEFSLPISFSSDRPGRSTDTLVVEDSCGITWKVPVRAEAVDTLNSVEGTVWDHASLNLSIVPNPVSSSSQLTIAFQLRSRSSVTIQIFNDRGELIGEREGIVAEPGERKELFEVHEFPSGMYYLTVQTEEGKGVQPFTIVR